MKIHKRLFSRFGDGSNWTRSFCGRLNQACTDGMNIAEDWKDVTCKFCLKKVPNPGSQEAQDKGCICPILDNCHGRKDLTFGRWYINLKCKIHNSKVEKHNI